MPQFTAIDPDRLDEEWVVQPTRYHKWAKKLAKAKKRVADLKAILDVTEADCAKFIRKNPAKYEVNKVTDASVKAAVKRHPSYVEAQKQYNAAQYKEDLYTAAVKALEHRKSALQDLVFLWGQSYFAGTMKTRKGTSDNIRDRLAESKVKASVTRKRKK